MKSVCGLCWDFEANIFFCPAFACGKLELTALMLLLNGLFLFPAVLKKGLVRFLDSDAIVLEIETFVFLMDTLETYVPDVLGFAGSLCSSCSFLVLVSSSTDLICFQLLHR